MEKQVSAKPLISVLTPSIRPAGLEIVQQCLKSQSFKDFEWLTEVGLGAKHDLNAAYNRMLKRAKGELIVFYQDYIKVPNDFLLMVRTHIDMLTTCYTFPVGKIETLDYSGDATWDWRHEESREIKWMEWEIDLACAPRQMLLKTGGFDEALDAYWSFDNVNIALRLAFEACKFYNSTATHGIAYDHDAHMPHPFRAKRNSQFHNQRLDEIRMGLKIDHVH